MSAGYKKFLLLLILSTLINVSCQTTNSNSTNITPQPTATASSPNSTEPVAQQQPQPAPTSLPTDFVAQKLHREALVIDAHADTIQAVLAGKNLAQRQQSGQIDIPRMQAGGLDAEFFAIFVDPLVYPGDKTIPRTEQMLTTIEQFCAQNSAHVQLARTTKELEAAQAQGKIAILIGIEGGHAINNSLTALRDFSQRGVRYMGLTWSNTNDWADAVDDVARHQGLTEFGGQVVAEMNKLGMLIDVSHVSDKTFYDVLAVSKQPVIASHSSCRAVTNHPRNMSDEMLRALAKQGGVCCINFYSKFIDQAYLQRESKYSKPGTPPTLAQFNGDRDRWAVARFQRFITSNGNPAPELKSLIDHIDYAVKVAGIDHVGLGSDFDGIDALPKGMTDAGMLPNITKELLKRGYSQTDIKKILGGNLLRVLKAAEQP